MEEWGDSTQNNLNVKQTKRESTTSSDNVINQEDYRGVPYQS